MTHVQQGAVVAGLRLERLVGRGGEGDVWEARRPDGQRRALKLVRPEAVAPPEQVAVRGDWLRRIDHPALVRVRRTGTLAEDPWRGWGLVEMDFVDGADLSAPLPRPDALHRLAPLAEGLDLLHAGRWSNGTPLVHRDVKPANLIDVPGGPVVLVDNSSLCGVDRTMLTRIGTPAFAAPEVVTGRIGPPADVYSFAATLVAVRTGARGEALLAHLDAPWTLDLPSTLRRALDPDPTRRPTACVDLLQRESAHAVDGWLPAVSALGAGHPPARGQDAEAIEDPHRIRVRSSIDSAETPRSDTGSDQVPAPPPRAVWPFLVLLGGLATLLGGAALRPETLGVRWLVAAAALSIVAHAAAQRRLWGAVLAPFVSWATLLAERASTVHARRDWVRTTATGVLTAAAVLTVQALQQAGPDGSGRLLAATAVVAYLLTVTTVAVARSDTGLPGARVVLVPFTLLGAALLLVAAALALPVGAVTGDRRTAPRLFRQAGRGLAAVGGERLHGSAVRRDQTVRDATAHAPPPGFPVPDVSEAPAGSFGVGRGPDRGPVGDVVRTAGAGFDRDGARGADTPPRSRVGA